jgi:hypothetical protein
MAEMAMLHEDLCSLADPLRQIKIPNAGLGAGHEVVQRVFIVEL